MNHHVITISGLPGCGKSTTAKLLAEKLNFKYIDTGTIFRQLAEKHKMTLHQFEQYSNDHHEIDKELDANIINQVKSSHVGVVLQGRLAGWMCKLNNLPAYKVWLYLDINKRAERIAEREKISYEEASADIDFREKSIINRYKEVYSIDYQDTSIYDLKLETNLSPNEIVDEIINSLQKSQ